MNHPFIKMLRFEWKSNYMMWIFNLIIGVGLLTTLYFGMQSSCKPVIPQVLIPMFVLLTWIFTINSYQESVKIQSMQMYHLIPIDRNTKFFSKQLITLIAFPLSLVILTTILIGIIGMFVDDQEIFDTSNSFYAQRKYYPILWILGHSVCTFFAIVFEKHKIEYAILTYFGFHIVLGLAIWIIASFISGLKNNPLRVFPDIVSSSSILAIIGFLIFAAVFYALSYRLFFRRQL